MVQNVKIAVFYCLRVVHCMPSRSHVLSMDKLAEAIEQLSSHCAMCGGRFRIESERRFGLATVLHVRCTASHSLFKINSCERITERGGRKWAVNIGAVREQEEQHI